MIQQGKKSWWVVRSGNGKCSQKSQLRRIRLLIFQYSELREDYWPLSSLEVVALIQPKLQVMQLYGPFWILIHKILILVSQSHLFGRWKSPKLRRIDVCAERHIMYPKEKSLDGEATFLRPPVDPPFNNSRLFDSF